MRYPQADRSDAKPHNLHPHGYTTVLEHDGQIVTQTDVITVYPTDLFPNPPKLSLKSYMCRKDEV